MILQDFHFGPDGNLLPQYQAQFEANFDPAKATPAPVLRTAPQMIIDAIGINRGSSNNTQPVLQNPQSDVDLSGLYADTGYTQSPLMQVAQGGQPILFPQQAYQGKPAPANTPVLTTGNPSAPTAQTMAPPPVLTAAPSTVAPTGTQQQTGNKRDATALSVPRQKMSLGEVMGRYGGAIMNAGSQGGMAQVGAMGTVTGQIADKEREMERYAYEQQLAQQQAQAKAITDAEENGAVVAEYDAAIAQMDKLYNDIISAGDTLTGPIDGTAGALKDRIQGDPKAAIRLAMEQFKVDQMLINIAKTKGAISDREMALFGKPMPSMLDDEKVWLDFIYPRMQAAKAIRNRIASGTRVNSTQDVATSPSTPQSSAGYSPEDQAIIDKYTTPQ